MNSAAQVDEVVHDEFLEINLHGRLSRDDYEESRRPKVYHGGQYYEDAVHAPQLNGH